MSRHMGGAHMGNGEHNTSASSGEDDMGSPYSPGAAAVLRPEHMGTVAPSMSTQSQQAHHTRTVAPPNTLDMTVHYPPANTTVPLTSPPNGSASSGVSRTSATSKIDYLRQWSVSTYKCTRQLLAERLGKGTRTVDIELESQIEALRDTQQKYLNVLRLARALSSHFYHVVQTQYGLAESFSDLAQKSPELQEEFLYNAETQRNLSKNGETLLGALNFFVSSLNTLCNKTIEDTLLTIKQYENARLEYDAYRTDLEELSAQHAALQQQHAAAGSLSSKLDEAQRNFTIHKEKYERLRGDVNIKMKFLDENKVKVMHRQLLLFHNAVSAYFSGNQASLDATLKQFNIKVKSPNSTAGGSWLEQ